MNGILYNSAILTALWEESQKDNLELLKPFILYLVDENTSIGNEINCDLIIKKLEKEFCFKPLPIVILHKTFNRLKDYIKKKNHKYFLFKDCSEETSKFKISMLQVRTDSQEVIIAIKDYLNSKNIKHKPFTNEEIESFFIRFLEDNGFVTLNR